jgi:hypothetical protein
MADIRFKDLTTTASSTASDDFIAVDGTTNGTRKLSAFSPTFGGNATVTGTLTVNSTSSFADRITLRKDVAGNVEQLIDNRNTAGGEVIYLSEDGLSTEYAYIARYNSAHATTSKRKALEFGVNGTGAFYNFASGVLKVSDTTASTTTSTGALVVGNGTSGGLGVGGAINAGGTLTVSGSTVIDSLPTSAVFGGTKRVAIGYDTSNDWGFVAAPNTGISWQELRLNPYGGMVKIPTGTTASSTITGALVVGNGVDGGIGASGSIWSGGTLTATTGSNSGVLQLNLINNSAGNAASSLFRFNAGTRTATLQAYNDTHATLAGQLRVGTSNGDIVVVPSGVATATFSGSGLASFGGSVTSRIDVNGSTSAGLGLRQTGVRDWFLSAESSELRVSCLTAGSIFAFTSGTPVALRDTTASTSTSSGALVVSGGVGVAGNVSSGGQVAATGTGTSGPYIANSAVIDYDSSTARFYGRGPNTSTRPSLGFYSTYSDGAGGLTLMTFNASGAATISTGLTLSNTSQSRAAWGDVGAQLSIAGAVITDTSSSGTVSRAVVNSIAASALAASSTTTYTQAASLFVAGAPTANTNVTITNAYAIYTAGGRINFQGLPTSSAGLQAGTLWNDGGTLKVA